MEPALLILGIQAILRAARAGADLYCEHARDRNVILPNLVLPPGSRAEQLILYLEANPSIADADPHLSSIWDKQNKVLKSDKPELIDAAYIVMLHHKATDQLVKSGRDKKAAIHEAKELAAGHMVEQWRKERKPPSAFARMALTLTDIGLEFVASDPSIIGVGTRGEKLIVAFAKNMSVLIPDNVDAFGSETDFANRVLGIFLRAGLGALTNNASTIFGDEDIAKILQGVTKPIIDALPESILDQISYRDIVDALAGPSAEAVFTLLAENTEIYLGRSFADDKALGAVTSAFFKAIKTTAHSGSVVDVFSEQGAIRLYQAGLKVAIERPGLFGRVGDSSNSKLFEGLLSGAASALAKYPRFNGPLGASLAAMAIEVIGDNAPTLLKLNPDEPWEKVTITVMGQVATGLGEALKKVNTDGSPGGALKSLTDAQLLELGRVILAQTAKTPGMLGLNQFEIQLIVAGIAEAMEADENLLLTADEWIKIAGIAAQKAASNPDRLFGVSSAGHPASALAVTIIKSVLKVAGDKWSAAGRSAGTLLFGNTLREALEIVIKALTGNVTAITDNLGLIGELLNDILTKASVVPAKIGSDGILKVLNAYIGTVLSKGTLPDDKEIDRVLST